MGALVGIRGQRGFTDHLYDASGTTGAAAQLILPVGFYRSSLIVENLSDTAMYLGIGGPTATVSISGGALSSFTVVNAGMGYSRPPQVILLGGGWDANRGAPTYSTQCSADFPAPSHPGSAHCVMTGSAGSQTISSIAIDDPGAGYVMPPYVLIQNDPLDPFGSYVPSAGNGLLLAASGGSYTSNGSVCTTDQISIYCAASSKAFTCKYSL